MLRHMSVVDLDYLCYVTSHRCITGRCFHRLSPAVTSIVVIPPKPAPPVPLTQTIATATASNKCHENVERHKFTNNFVLHSMCKAMNLHPRYLNKNDTSPRHSNILRINPPPTLNLNLRRYSRDCLRFLDFLYFHIIIPSITLLSILGRVLAQHGTSCRPALTLGY